MRNHSLLYVVALSALFVSLGVPATSFAQSCGGPACSDTEICCRRDSANGAQGTDADYQFMLCVPTMQQCTNMGGYNAYPEVGTAPTSEIDDTSSGGLGSNRNGEGGGLINVARASTIDQLVVVVLGAVVYIGTILLILALVWVGFLFVVAQGAAEKIQEARAALMWTVVGGLLLLGAEALSLVVQATIESL